jgi:hypothetical protein
VGDVIASSTVPLTITATYTARTCVKACYDAGAKFANFKTSGAECLCYSQTTSCDVGNKAAHSGSETFEVKCPCYYTTPVSV